MDKPGRRVTRHSLFQEAIINARLATHLPHELYGMVIDYLSNDHYTLKNCILVCRAWVIPARCHLFATFTINCRSWMPERRRRIKRQLDLLCKPGSNIPDFIRSIHLTQGWIGDSSCLKQLPFSKMRSLNSIHLGVDWLWASPVLKATLTEIMQYFKEINFKGSFFSGPDEVIGLLSNATIMHSLSFLSTNFNQPRSASKLPHRAFKSVSFEATPVSFDWLVDCSIIRLKARVDSDILALAAILEQGVVNLSVSYNNDLVPAQNQHIHIESKTLRYITFEGVSQSPQEHQWISDLLARVRSPGLKHIHFNIFITPDQPCPPPDFSFIAAIFSHGIAEMRHPEIQISLSTYCKTEHMRQRIVLFRARKVMVNAVLCFGQAGLNDRFTCPARNPF